MSTQPRDARSSRIPGEGTRITRDTFPGSRKVFIEGSHPSIRVPFREIRQSPTRVSAPDGTTREEANPPLCVYDTSGPYTDPDVEIDVHRGLDPIRREWILERGDVEELDGVSSDFARRRASDPSLERVRFQRARPPLRATSGRHVTQMAYARRGEVTPEMEYVAIRETQRLEELGELAHQHAGESWGAPSRRR